MRVPPAVKMSHSMPRSSTSFPNDELTVSGPRNYPNTMSSSKSCFSSQTDFPGSSTSPNLWDRSSAPPGRTHIANSSNVNNATHPVGFAADSSNHVTNMSIDAAINSSSASDASEAASAPSFSTCKSYAQLNDSMIDNTARSQSLTAKSINFNGFIPMMPMNAPGPQNTHTHPAATSFKQYTGYETPFHNRPNFHSAQYHDKVKILRPPASVENHSPMISRCSMAHN
ncbi:uncharacterized protein EDB93DRAFT_551923 [Suillus bovinus]|uniref:uncharacterized protein n=1 Tax=Suillus bovinus TaxID=48563 RepID=UPI001B8828E2|nr:uncharacterized protein EDB93DRAFT_551923 [Suillus bovinus]KAG2158524.1 hypothetical protein EDB93DRAFT_551923 [Suillus bovinus]